MTNLCDSIDTLSMALCDGELAGDELRDLELHLTECATCRHHVAAQDAALADLRRRMAAPPAPELLRARVARALDVEDKAVRRGPLTWLLPGVAAVAAVAALALFFVTSRTPVHHRRDVTGTAVAIAQRDRPLDVEGASTDQWVQRNYDANVEVPTFVDDQVQRWGARLTDVFDREAVQLFYRIITPRGRAMDVRVLIFDARGLDIDGERTVIEGRELRYGTYQGLSVVSFVDGDGRAYVFSTPHLTPGDLAALVGRSSLLQQIRDRDGVR